MNTKKHPEWLLQFFCVGVHKRKDFFAFLFPPLFFSALGGMLLTSAISSDTLGTAEWLKIAAGFPLSAIGTAQYVFLFLGRLSDAAWSRGLLTFCLVFTVLTGGAAMLFGGSALMPVLSYCISVSLFLYLLFAPSKE